MLIQLLFGLTGERVKPLCGRKLSLQLMRSSFLMTRWPSFLRVITSACVKWFLPAFNDVKVGFWELELPNCIIQFDETPAPVWLLNAYCNLFFSLHLILSDILINCAILKMQIQPRSGPSLTSLQCWSWMEVLEQQWVALVQSKYCEFKLSDHTPSWSSTYLVHFLFWFCWTGFFLMFCIRFHCNFSTTYLLACN